MFERLTQRCDLGLSEFEEICFINPDDVEGMYTLDEIVDFGSHETRLAIAKRLAAYEDSGLSPEEVVQLIKNQLKDAEFDIGTEGFLLAIDRVFQNKYGMSAEEVGELAKAKTEGRLVVLPCKVDELKEKYRELTKPTGDEAETYTTGYRSGHRNGQTELIAYLLQIDTGAREEAEKALEAMSRGSERS